MIKFKWTCVDHHEDDDHDDHYHHHDHHASRSGDDVGNVVVGLAGVVVGFGVDCKKRAINNIV